MKPQMNRKAFLQATLATAIVGIGCSSEEDGGSGTGGSGSGSGGDAGSGGSTGSGGAGNTGGSTGPGGADGSGGDDGSGGADGTGGDDATGGADATGGSDAGPMCTEDIRITSSGNNHTHDFILTAAELNAGVEITKNTEGPNHLHCLTITADELKTIREGGVVTKYTCNGGDHGYVISCASSAPAPVTPTEMECASTPNLGTAC